MRYSTDHELLRGVVKLGTKVQCTPLKFIELLIRVDIVTRGRRVLVEAWMVCIGGWFRGWRSDYAESRRRRSLWLAIARTSWSTWFALGIVSVGTRLALYMEDHFVSVGRIRRGGT